MILSVDPGLSGCGRALFAEGRLHRAGYIPNPLPITKGDTSTTARVFAMAQKLVPIEDIELIAFERPQLYAAGKGKGNPNLLVPLAQIGSCLMGLLTCPMAEYFPHEWKGNVEKIEGTIRVRSRLSADEFSRVVFPERVCVECRKKYAQRCLKPKSCLANNVFDAIGIGLKQLGRFEKWRVIAR